MEDGRLFYDCDDLGHEESYKLRIEKAAVNGPGHGPARAANPYGSVARQLFPSQRWEQLSEGLKRRMVAEAWQQDRVVKGLMEEVKQQLQRPRYEWSLDDDWSHLRNELTEQLLEDDEVKERLVEELKEDRDVKQEAIEELKEDDDVRQEAVDELKEDDDVRKEAIGELKQEQGEWLRDKVMDALKDDAEEQLKKHIMDETRAAMTPAKRKELRELAWKKIVDRWVVGLARKLDITIKKNSEAGGSLRTDVLELIAAAGRRGGSERPEQSLATAAAARPTGVQKRVEAGTRKGSTARLPSGGAKHRVVRRRRKRHHDRKSY